MMQRIRIGSLKGIRWKSAAILTVAVLFVMAAKWYSPAWAGYDAERMNILPGSFFTGDWNNPKAVFIQDLGSDADSGRFTVDNAAFIDEELVTIQQRDQQVIEPSSAAAITSGGVELDKVAGEGKENEQAVMPGGQVSQQPVTDSEAAVEVPTLTATPEAESLPVEGMPVQVVANAVEATSDEQTTRTEGVDAGDALQAVTDVITPSSDEQATRTEGVDAGIPAGDALQAVMPVVSWWGSRPSPVVTIARHGIFVKAGRMLGSLGGLLHIGIGSVVADDADVVGGKSLELYDFKIAPEAEKKTIENIQLRFSLSAKKGQGGGEGDTQADSDLLYVQYFYKDAWNTLGKIDLRDEVSNQLNSGYFLYGLPLLDSADGLDRMRVRFVFQDRDGKRDTKVYLDSVWLEIDQRAAEQQPELGNTGDLDEETTDNQSGLSGLVDSLLMGNVFEIFNNVPANDPIDGTSIERRENGRTERQESMVRINDPEVKHRCAVEPFRAHLSQGKSATYAITMWPSGEGKTYALTVGDLPNGVSAMFGEEKRDNATTTREVALSLETRADAQRGSFNIPILYKEKEDTGDVLTACQLNLSIK